MKNHLLADSGAHLLGIDLGGTKILAAVVDAEGQVLGTAKLATKAQAGVDAVVERIAEVAESAISDSKVEKGSVVAAGIGAPGPVDVSLGTIYSPPNLEGWGVVPLGPNLSKRLGTPVYVDNDVNVGTLGEYSLGAGQGARDMVGVFVGTGVGGGVVIDGRLRRGFRWGAGEIGHMIMVPHGPLCGCGQRGCLEAVASRTAIEREVMSAISAGRPTIVGKLIADSKKQRLTSGVIAKALQQGDPLMQEVIGQVQYYLGLLVANIVNFIDPEMIVFGGGVVEALGDSFVEPIRKVSRAHFKLQHEAERVRIVPAMLADHAGVLGAAILASQQSGLGR